MVLKKPRSAKCTGTDAAASAAAQDTQNIQHFVAAFLFMMQIFSTFEDYRLISVMDGALQR